MLRTKWLALSDDQRRAYADPNRRCIERGCDEPAGTPWGPYWCAAHDDERLDRISAQLNAISGEICADYRAALAAWEAER